MSFRRSASKKYFVISSLILAFAFQTIALAQEDDSTKPAAAEESAPVVVETDSSTVASSDLPTPIRPFGMMAKFGLIYFNGVGGGLEVGGALKDKWQINGELLFSEGTFTGSDKDFDEEDTIFDTKRTEEMRFSLVELGLKTRWFPVRSVLSSFNVLGGAAFEYAKGEVGYNIEKEFFFTSESEEFLGRNFEGYASTLQLGVSNIWHFDFGMFIGADWLTLSVPLFTHVNVFGGDSDLESEYISDEDRKDIEDLGNKCLRNLLTVKSSAVIGWRF